MEKVRLKLYVTIFLSVLVFGTIGFMAVEDLGFEDSIYFTIVTMATVGYGDIAPHTQAGKALAVILIVVGVGTFLGVIAGATEAFLSRRENEARRRKLHMTIGLFFSEVGKGLLHLLTAADATLDPIRPALTIGEHWSPQDYDGHRASLLHHQFAIRHESMDWAALRTFCGEKSDLLVRLMESPYLVEHEAFTDLLIAILHLKEELALRGSFADLPEKDLQHLAGDANRVYSPLAHQWFDYMRQLKGSYPFLFSLGLRTNPFDPDTKPVIGG